MVDEHKVAISQLAKKALQNQAHIMTILRLLAMKRIITVREFNVVYDKTLRELKEDILRDLMVRQDMALANLAKGLGRI